MKFPCDYIIHCEPNEKEKEVTWSDFEELIRCKDCKAYNGMKCVRNNMIAVRADDFCSRAEKIED